jgi:hypothetical protein
MTSLVAWVGRDSRSLSSAYIATDSRISWLPHETWDGGRKTFASATCPEIIGYVGDVLAPSVVLSQFSTALDLRVLGGTNARDRFVALADMLKRQVEAIPAMHQKRFTVIQCARIEEGMASTFQVNVIDYEGGGKWRREVLDAPDASAQLLVKGSGEAQVHKRLAKWEKSDVAGTSRAVFGAFVDAVESGADPRSSGPIQLVGLQRTGSGRVFGVWHKGQRYLAGSSVPHVAACAEVRWFNTRFERCDSRTGRVIGQRQPRPGKL